MKFRRSIVDGLDCYAVVLGGIVLGWVRRNWDTGRWGSRSVDARDRFVYDFDTRAHAAESLRPA